MEFEFITCVYSETFVKLAKVKIDELKEKGYEVVDITAQVNHNNCWLGIIKYTKKSASNITNGD